MKIRAIIVDDEPHAREGIRLRLKKYKNIQIVEECSSGKKAVTAINTLKPDLIFLDIQMPEMNGFEVLKKVSASPLPFIIFVTAYDKYAIKAFEYHALDYLLKPISEERFKEAIKIAIAEVNHRNLEVYAGKLKSVISDYLNFVEPAEKVPSKISKGKDFISRLMIKAKEQILMISVEEIDWLESAGDYIYVHSKSQKYLVRGTLTSLEQKLDPQRFTRIHRSTIVNIEQVKSLKPNIHGDYDVFLQSGDNLRLSRSYKEKFQKVTGNLY